MTKEQSDWIAGEVERFRAQAAQFRAQALMCDGAMQAFEQLLGKFPVEAAAPSPSTDAARPG